MGGGKFFVWSTLFTDNPSMYLSKGKPWWLSHSLMQLSFFLSLGQVHHKWENLPVGGHVPLPLHKIHEVKMFASQCFKNFNCSTDFTWPRWYIWNISCGNILWRTFSIPWEFICLKSIVTLGRWSMYKPEVPVVQELPRLPRHLLADVLDQPKTLWPACLQKKLFNC